MTEKIKQILESHGIYNVPTGIENMIAEIEKLFDPAFSQTEETKIYQAALDKWGFDNQRDKCIEEMAELTQAIIKERQYQSFQATMNVIEEIADVQIVLNQMYLIYGIQNVDTDKEIKLKRLQETIKT